MNAGLRFLNITVLKENKKMELFDTFAYILGTCEWSKKVVSELSMIDYSGIIELCISREDQALSIGNLQDTIPLQSTTLSRFSPVQLTWKWDVRPYFLERFSEAQRKPKWFLGETLDTNALDSNIIYIDDLPSNLEETLVSNLDMRQEDKERFDLIFAATFAKAKRDRLGMILIADWGWDYEINNELKLETKNLFLDYGMIVADRHA